MAAKSSPMPVTGLASRMFEPPATPQEVFVTSVKLGPDGVWVVAWAMPDRQGGARMLDVTVKADLSKLTADELVKAAIEDAEEQARAFFAELWA